MKVLIELFQKFTVSKGRAFGGIFKGKALELTRRFDMTKKEDTFCCYYSSNGNAELSAVMEGYAKNAGQRLLMKKGISERIKEYRNIRLENLRLAALTGYERLAFGSIADSIKLLYMENPQAEMLEKMDLYMISEIKRPKEGAMEIKFFDRLKALEKICEVQQNPEETCMPFYKALEKSAGIFNGDEVSSDDAD